MTTDKQDIERVRDSLKESLGCGEWYHHDEIHLKLADKIFISPKHIVAAIETYDSPYKARLERAREVIDEDLIRLNEIEKDTCGSSNPKDWDWNTTPQEVANMMCLINEMWTVLKND